MINLTFSFVVPLVQSSLTIIGSPSPYVLGQVWTLTATVTNIDLQRPALFPNGTVSVLGYQDISCNLGYLNPSAASCTITVNSTQVSPSYSQVSYSGFTSSQYYFWGSSIPLRVVPYITPGTPMSLLALNSNISRYLHLGMQPGELK